MDLISPENIEIFFLSFVRIVTIVMVLPVIGYEPINKSVKVMFSLIFTSLLIPSISAIDIPVSLANSNLLTFFVFVLNESITGIIIGFIPFFIFAAFQFAGELMGIQMGLSMMSQFDPSAGTNLGIMGRLQYIFLMTIFLMIGGHIFFFEAIVRSFEVIPIGSISYNGIAGILGIIIHHTSEIFVIGIKAGAPVIVSLFVMDAGLGIIARTVPQMNIFLVGIPLKIGAGLVIFLIVLGFIVKLFIKYFGEIQSDLFKIIDFLA